MSLAIPSARELREALHRAAVENARRRVVEAECARLRQENDYLRKLFEVEPTSTVAAMDAHALLGQMELEPESILSARRRTLNEATRNYEVGRPRRSGWLQERLNRAVS
jgi:hypothetical protein